MNYLVFVKPLRHCSRNPCSGFVEALCVYCGGGASSDDSGSGEALCL